MATIQLYVSNDTIVDFIQLDEAKQKSLRQKAIKLIESEIKTYKTKFAGK